MEAMKMENELARDGRRHGEGGARAARHRGREGAVLIELE